MSLRWAHGTLSNGRSAGPTHICLNGGAAVSGPDAAAASRGSHVVLLH